MRDGCLLTVQFTTRTSAADAVKMAIVHTTPWAVVTAATIMQADSASHWKSLWLIAIGFGKDSTKGRPIISCIIFGMVVSAIDHVP